ncbi:MAG TPA: GNAT family N-acetyltransferase [Anaerolineales bacterium]
MITNHDVIYRQIVTLHDGARVLLRPLAPDDRQALIDMYAPISPEDRRYTRHDVTDPEVVGKWVDELNYDKVLPLIAVIGNRIVGNATLHFFEGPGRHRAEVRIFLAKEIRRRGVGSRMLQALIDLAKRRNIYLIEAQILNDQASVIKAFQALGFNLKCVFEDYFILPDGELRDIANLILYLRDSGGEF